MSDDYEALLVWAEKTALTNRFSPGLVYWKRLEEEAAQREILWLDCSCPTLCHFENDISSYNAENLIHDSALKLSYLLAMRAELKTKKMQSLQ